MPSCRVRVFRTEAQALKEDEHVLNAAETYSAVVDWAVSTFSTPASQWLLFDCSSSNPIGRGALKDCLPEGNCQLELVQTSAAQLKREERISVAPKPSTAEKDVQPLFQQGIKGGLEELVDNSISALLQPANLRRLQQSAGGWTPRIWIEFADDTDDAKAAFIIQDNGVGMRRDIARTFLRMSQSWSRGIPPLLRSKRHPLRLDLFRHPNLSRFGFGANAIQGFGGTCEVTTREYGTSVQFQLLLDREECLKEYSEGGTGWGATFSEHFATDSAGASSGSVEDVLGPFQLRHGTRIRITHLHKNVLASLRNRDVLMQIRAEVAQDYFFFLCGFPEVIRSHIPYHLQYEHSDTLLSISMFEQALEKPPLNASSLQSMPREDSPAMLHMMAKMEELGAQNVPFKPFVLALRYVPKECEETLEEDEIEEVPNDTQVDLALEALKEVAIKADDLLNGRTGGSKASTPVAGKSQAKKGDRRSSGKPVANRSKGKKGMNSEAGPSNAQAAAVRPGGRQQAPKPRDADTPLQEYDERFKPAVVDMQLVLFNFPFMKGSATKPNAGRGSAGDAISSWRDKEPFIFTFWSGRLLPHCGFNSALPKLVEKARQLGQSLAMDKAHKLDADHLTGILLLSPECTTLYHKTDVQKGRGAYDALVNLGPEPRVVLGGAESTPADGQAGMMYTYDYNRMEFRPDSVGAYATRLLLSHFEEHWSKLDDDGNLKDTVFQPSSYHNGRLVEQSAQYELANHPVVIDVLCAKELVKKVVDGKTAAEGSEGSAAQQVPKDYYVIHRFYSLGTDTRRDHYAEVSRWAPSWFPIPDEQLWLENVIHFQPLPYPTMAARLNAATEMMKNWEENCAPHHLAFVKREGAPAQASKRRGSGKGAAEQESASRSSKADKRDTTQVASEALGLEGGQEGVVFRSDSLFEQLDVVVATKSGKAMSRSMLHKQLVHKQMVDADQWARTLTAVLKRGNATVWNAQFKCGSLWLEYHLSGFRQHALSEGSYTLSMTVEETEDAHFPLPALKMDLKFEVQPDPASKIVAKFVSDEGEALADDERLVRLGLPMATLLLTLENDKGTKLPLPALAQVRSDLKVSLLLAGGNDAGASTGTEGSWVSHQTLAVPQGLELQGNGRGVAVSGLVVRGFALKGGTRAARLRVELRDLSCTVDITLAAGQPSKIVVSPPDMTHKDIAKGEPIGNLFFSIEDAFNNRYLPLQEHDVQLNLTLKNVWNSRDKAVEVLKLKLDEERGLASPPAKLHLLALGPVGSHAIINAAVTAPDFEIEQTCVLKRLIFPVHLGFEHPLLEEEAQSRRKVRKEDEDGGPSSSQALAASTSSQFPGLVKVLKLDLLDYVEKYSQPGKKVPPKLDVNSWSQLADLHAGLTVLPDGSVLRPTGERYSVRQRRVLISSLNTLLGEGRAVHEVVAVVAPGATELKGMALQICRADNDELDADWQADVKMFLCCKDSDGDDTQQVLPDLSYKLRGGQSAVPFSVPLSDEYFVHNNTVKVLFADAHKEEIAYGGMYIRQVSAPRRACMLPIGRLFNGISASLKGKPGTLRLASEATGGASTDPCYTLEGWKLDSTAVAFDDLAELPQLQGSGLSVCRRESFHLHLAFQDQFGAPIEVPEDQRAWMQERARLSVTSTQAMGSEAGSSSAATGCASIKSWTWSSLPVPVVRPFEPWPMPLCTVEVEVQQAAEASLLQLQLSVPGPGGVAVELGQVQVPVQLQARAMKQDGYVVHTLRGGEVLSTRTIVEEEGAVGSKRRRVAAGQQAADKEQPLAKRGGKAPAQAREQAQEQAQAHRMVEVEVNCREEEVIELQVALVDEDEAAIGSVGEDDFVLEAAGDAQLSAQLRVSGGKLVLAFKGPRASPSTLQRVALAAAGTTQPLETLQLWVRPASSRVSHALPMLFNVNIHPGSYALAIGDPVDGGSTEQATSLSISLPDDLEDPCMFKWLPVMQVIGANGRPWTAPQPAGQHQRPGTSEEAALKMVVQWRRLSEHWDSPNDAGDPSPESPSELETGLLRVDAQGHTACRVPLPHLPGTWVLYAADLPGMRTDWLYKVAVAPGRPCTIQLAEDSSAVAQALWQHPQKTMVYTQPSVASAKGAQQKQSKRAVEMPQLQGWLCDRHNNRCTIDSELRVVLCLRQDDTLDLDLAHSVVSGDSGFVFEPSHTLAKLLQLASEQRQAASAGPQPLLPEVHVVLKCTERRTDRGWAQLPDEHAVQECPRATLLEVPADDSEKAALTKKITDNENKKTNLEKSRADWRKGVEERKVALDGAQKRLQQATRTLSASLEGAPSVEAAIVQRQQDSDAAREELARSAERTPLQEMAQDLYWPWCAPNRGDNPIIAHAAALRALKPGKVLGPVACLGAVERKEVAEAMAQLMSDGLSCVCVLGDDTRRSVEDFLRNKRVSRVNILNLEDKNAMSEFKFVPPQENDPQKRLLIESGRNFQNVLDRSNINFVGYAVNLLVLPPTLLSFKVGHRNFNLRQSLLWYFLRDSMVFETAQDLETFVAVCNQQDVQFRNRLISLDGKTYNMRRGMHTTVNERQTPPMHWATLPASVLLSSQVLLDNKLDQLQTRMAAAAMGAELLRNKEREVARCQAELENARNAYDLAHSELEQRSVSLDRSLADIKAELAEDKRQLEAYNKRKEALRKAARVAAGAARRDEGPSRFTNTGRQQGEGTSAQPGAGPSSRPAAGAASPKDATPGKKRGADLLGGGSNTAARRPRKS